MPAEPSNFRPVNTLPYLAKLIERVVFKQITEYIEENKLLPDEMSAYRANYNTEMVVAALTNEILCNMDVRKITMLVAVDLSAAFDCVNHAILLNTMSSHYGVKDKALEWIKDYLDGRRIRTKVRSTLSQEHELKMSVPQGSVGGPILYNYYCSTLTTVIDKTVKLLGYADDNTFLAAFRAGNAEEEKQSHILIETTLLQTKAWMGQKQITYERQQNRVRGVW